MGYRVTVLEQTRHVGGRTYSFVEKSTGELLDNGEHVILGLCDHFQFLLGEAGLSSMVALQPLLRVPVATSKLASNLGSSRLAGSLHMAPSILGYRLLSPVERLRVLKAGLAIQTTRSISNLDSTSFAEWLERHGQSANAIKNFWDAIGTGVLNARSHQVSAELAIKTFRLLLKEGWRGGRLGLFCRPLSEVTAGFQKHLEKAGVEFQFEHRVERVNVEQEQSVGVSGVDGVLSSPLVVLAIPPDRIRELAERSGISSEITLPEFTFSPILNVYLFYEGQVLSEDLILLPDDFGAMVFNRTRLFGDETSGRTTLAVSISAAHDLRQLPMREISKMVEETVRNRLSLPKAFSAKSVWQPHATFLALPGTEQMRPASKTSINGLYLAGDWTSTGWPACIEGAALSGRNVAAEIASTKEKEGALNTI